MVAWTPTLFLRREYSHADGRTIRIYENTRGDGWRWRVHLDAPAGSDEPDWRWELDTETEARDVWRSIVGLDEEWRDVTWR